MSLLLMCKSYTQMKDKYYTQLWRGSLNSAL